MNKISNTSTNSGVRCFKSSYVQARLRVLAGPFLLCLLLLATVGPVRAQAFTSADSAATLLGAAEIFEAEGELETAAALYRLIAETFENTPTAARARERLDALNQIGEEGNGSVEFRVWATGYGLFLGIAVPSALSTGGSRPYGAGLLLGGPAGYLGGARMARSLNLTKGQARSITFGGTWGTWQGFGWATTLDSGGSDETRWGATIIGGLSGIGVGTLLARKPITEKMATMVSFGSLWGTWFGSAASVLMRDEGESALTSALIGGNVGLLSAALLGPKWNISRNRLRLISIAGLAGGLSGLGVDLLIKTSNTKVAIAIPLATSILGLAIGIKTTADNDRSSASQDDPSMSGALLKFKEKRFGVGLPTPSPTVIPLDLPSGQRIWKPGVSFTLFAAKF